MAAAVAAAAAALPGLWFPFLADDWIVAAQVAAPLPQASALGYFRPLYVATFWLDRRLWGLSPALFHLTNLLLIALSAALVVTLMRRYVRDPFLAGATGILFAIHPWHVENAAWVAVRGDPLYACLVLGAALAYERWREDGRGVPILGLALFEAALLSKESAVVFPFALIAIGLLDRRHRPFPREALQGLVPMIVLAATHFIVLRPWALSGHPRVLAQGRWIDWIKRPFGYAVGAVLPADVEILGARSWLFTGVAAVVVGALVTAAWVRRGQIPRGVRTAAAAGAVFLILIVPAVVGFQERYIYLAAAASCLAIVSLLAAVGGRPAHVAAGVLVATWLTALVLQWSYWREAAVASESLIGGLVAASERPDVREIVVVNMPFRVRGGAVYVYDDFLPALAIAGGRPVPVHAVTYISYPTARSDALDGTASEAIHVTYFSLIDPGRPGLRSSSSPAEVRLRVREGLFRHFSGARPPSGVGTVEGRVGTVTFEPDGAILARIDPAPDGSRAAYAWVAGRLERLF